MGPLTESDEFESPPQTLCGQAARTTERVCLTAARWSIPLFMPVGCLFLIYVSGGHTAVSVGIWTPRYEFLSLSEDVYFAWLGFVFGITIRVGTGPLTGLAFLGEGEGGTHAELSILFWFVGFGSGAGIIRMTHTTVLATLLQRV